MLKYNLILLIAFLGANLNAMDNQKNGWDKFFNLKNKALDPIELKKLQTSCDIINMQQDSKKQNIKNICNNKEIDIELLFETERANGHQWVNDDSSTSEINSNVNSSDESKIPEVEKSKKRKKETIASRVNVKRTKTRENQRKDEKRMEQSKEKQAQEFLAIIKKVSGNNPIENIEELEILLKKDTEEKRNSSSMVKKINEFYTIN